MIAAAPKRGFLCGGLESKIQKKVPAPQCLAEALMRESRVWRRFSWFGCEPDQFMPVSPGSISLLSPSSFASSIMIIINNRLKY